jgi:multiple sugar transport system permease protein
MSNDLSADPVPLARPAARDEPRQRARGPARGLLDRLDRHFFALAVLPSFLAVFLVTVLPFLAGLGLSFSSISSTHDGIFPLTLHNYSRIAGDDQAKTVLINTFKYAVAAVVLEVVLGVLLAVLLSQKSRIMPGFRVIFLLPLTAASVVAATSWGALLNTSQGWINYWLGALHLGQPDWLASPHLAMPSVIITELWSGVPVVAVLVLAALLGAPQDPIEAAMVDGATPWQRFRYVTLPAVRPVIALAALLRVVAAFQQFALFQLLTGGGPGLSTTVLNYYVYKQAFAFNNIGYGAALATLMVGLMAIPLGLLFAASRRGRA